MMTKSDFQSIADVIRDATENMQQPDTRETFLKGKYAGIEEVAESMATMLKAQNPRFNREMFLKACGV